MTAAAVLLISCYLLTLPADLLTCPRGCLPALQDERDEWQRLADLLTTASGIPVSSQQAQTFFPAASLEMPDYDALHAAGGQPHLQCAVDLPATEAFSAAAAAATVASIAWMPRLLTCSTHPACPLPVPCLCLLLQASTQQSGMRRWTPKQCSGRSRRSTPRCSPKPAALAEKWLAGRWRTFGSWRMHGLVACSRITALGALHAALVHVLLASMLAVRAVLQ